MAGPAMTYSMVDYADVQGLVRFGYGRMTSASYALMRVKNVAAAKAWLRAAPVTNAVEKRPPPTTALQIAFTAPGLAKLGLPRSVMEGFSREFRNGMNTDYRNRLLGDVDFNAPKHWKWGGPESEPHLLVMFFAEPEHFDSFVQNTKGDTWSDAFEEVICLGTSNLDGDEPFGFADGISQPQIDWEQQRQTPCTQLEYTNIAALGEFLLGYRNEYGKITDRPLLDPDAANTELLPAVDAPAEISRRLPSWERKWLAARRQAILCCQSKMNQFPGHSQARLSRINLPTKLIQRGRVVLSAHTLGAQIRATATSPSDASAR